MSMLASAVKTRRSRSRDFARPAIVVIAMGALLGLGFFTTQQMITASRHTAARASMSGDDDVYTGSILYMPDRGNACRQILFDNRNGQMTDKGYVDCQLAFSHSVDSEPKQWSAARVRVISDGFRGN
jgi:hypothetical protein